MAWGNRIGDPAHRTLGTKFRICNTVSHDGVGADAAALRRTAVGTAVAGLAVLRRQPDVPDRAAARGAAEHAGRAGPGRAGPFGVLRRHRGAGEALAAADLHDGLRQRRRQPRPAGPRLPHRHQGHDAGRRAALPRARPGHVLLGARHVRRPGARTSPTPSSSGSAARRRSGSTSNPRPGTAATASAIGCCPPATTSSSSTGAG